MSLSVDNFVALNYLKTQVRKWKNIALLLLLTLLLAVFQISINDNPVSGPIASTESYIANINIEGVILEDEYRSNVLKKIAEQKNIKALIININSPGGGIVGSEVLYEDLLAISKVKPTVTVMGSLAASGAYMAAIASDYIIAHNGTLTGSIGVIMQAGEITDLAERVGIKFLTYKSSPLKGTPSPFEKTTPQVDRIINESVQDSYDFFANLVLERRKGKLDQDNLQNITDGRVFTGRQALRNGLIDEIGGMDQALLYLKNTHKIDTSKIKVHDIDLEKPEGSLLDKFFKGNFFNSLLGKNSLQGQLMAIMK